MPIRINLLAESQEQEEMRRRDPVKRAIWLGAFLGALVLAWSGYLQSKAMVASRQLAHMESQLHANTNEYQQVLTSKKKLDDANQKIAKLQQLSTNRFLTATVLDSLQHTTIDDVQLTRLRTGHEYVFTDEVKAKTNADGTSSRGKPATSLEKITLTIEARDTSDGDQWVKFKTAIADSSYFKSVLDKAHEIKVATPPQPQLVEGKKFANFTLECKFPEKLR
jgi:Tfp pilus assembly protein PilN